MLSLTAHIFLYITLLCYISHITVQYPPKVLLCPKGLQLISHRGRHVHAGLNINPTLINVGGSGQVNVVAGYSISPALISVQPTVHERIDVNTLVGSSQVTINQPEPPQPAVTPKPPKPLPGPPGKISISN